MTKNTSGQHAGAQLVSATDGSDFAGTVTVYITIDNGTQTIGSVGSGICTYEGHGYHTYDPSQAETNGDVIAFTFVGSGAVSATVQYETVLSPVAVSYFTPSAGSYTGQTLLNLMEDLNGELQLQSGEADVAKGLRALNAAQDQFETVLAQHPDVLGGQSGVVVQTLHQEYTTYPTGLLRIDSLWYLDPTTSRPSWKLTPSEQSGGHAISSSWLVNLAFNGGTGKPARYFTNGSRIYWDPLPDGANTIRWYGFQSATDITAAGYFAYPDVASYPVAVLASRIMKLGLDDDPGDFISLAKDLFDPLIATFSNAHRDGPKGMYYTRRHDT